MDVSIVGIGKSEYLLERRVLGERGGRGRRGIKDQASHLWEPLSLVVSDKQHLQCLIRTASFPDASQSLFKTFRTS